jgi:hypothetical protein
MFTLSVEKMAMDAVDKAEAKLMTIDLNHNKIPDLVEIKNDIATAVADLQEIEKEVTQDEMLAALNVLFPGKFTADQIVKGEAAIGKIIGSLLKVEAFVAEAKVVLGK